MIKTVDGFEYPDDAVTPVTCAAGCGQPATTWFGPTGSAHCGDIVCHATLQVRFNEVLSQKIADWHEGRAGLDQPLHEYLGISWAEYADWFRLKK
jgi:hypothetical protein